LHKYILGPTTAFRASVRQDEKLSFLTKMVTFDHCLSFHWCHFRVPTK